MVSIVDSNGFGIDNPQENSCFFYSGDGRHNQYEYWSILPYLGQALVDRLNEPETWQRYRALYEERNLSDLLDLVEAGGAQ
jgi:hypothetical protein